MQAGSNFDLRGGRMKREIILFLLLALFLLFCAVEVSAQEKSAITVTRYELNNGVVILDILKAGKVYELQCNHGFLRCTPLKSGKYVMVELPKNHGMYECRNVEVYPESITDPVAEEKLGSYCLSEK